MLEMEMFIYIIISFYKFYSIYPNAKEQNPLVETFVQYQNTFISKLRYQHFLLFLFLE